VRRHHCLAGVSQGRYATHRENVDQKVSMGFRFQ
jgi:hypothetical protein